MPLGMPLASVWAHSMASVALKTAVSKPKDWGMKLMSLSMVLGMPMTAILRLRACTSRLMLRAAFMLPSPPMTNRMLTLERSRLSTISSADWGPRDEPRMVPPKRWMSATRSGVSSTG